MKNRKLASIEPLLKKYVSPRVKAVMTDGYRAYNYFDKKTSIPHGDTQKFLYERHFRSKSKRWSQKSHRNTPYPHLWDRKTKWNR